MSIDRWCIAIRHEVRLVARARASWIALLALGMLAAIAGWNGARAVAQQRQTIDAVRDKDTRVYASIYTELEHLEQRGDPRPDLQLAGMAWYIYQPEGAAAPAPHIDPRRPEAASSEWVGARHAVLPPAPAGALAIGQRDLQPFYSRVTIRTRPVLVQSDEIEHPANLLSGRLDLAYVLLFCLPVVALPLLYNVIADDRDQGTLALVAAQPISVGSILTRRLAIRGTAVLVVVLTGAAIGLIAGDGWRGAGLAPAALFAIAVLATVVFWCGVAAAINMVPWCAAAGAAVYTAVWLALVVGAPAVIAETVAALAPVPSRIELITAVRLAGNLSPAQLTELVNDYYEEHPEAAVASHAADLTAIRGLAQQDAVDTRIDPILDAYRRAATRQQQLSDRLRWLSPPLAVYEAIADIAGSSASRYRRYAEQVDAFHRSWRGYFYPLVHARTTMTRDHYERAPRFQFEEEPFARVAVRSMALAAMPLACGLVLVAGAWRAARRSSVRT